MVLYFSGAGTQVPDMNGDEEDGADAALATFDMAPRKSDTWLTDDELIPLLATSKASRIFVFLDCSHSGGFAKTQLKTTASSSPGKSIVVFTATASNEVKFYFDDDELDYLGRNSEEPSRRFTSALTASLPREPSGRFTSAFIASLAKEPNSTLNELATTIRTTTEHWETALGERNRSTPQFTMPNPDMTLSQFLLGTEPPTSKRK